MGQGNALAAINGDGPAFAVLRLVIGERVRNGSGRRGTVVRTDSHYLIADRRGKRVVNSRVGTDIIGLDVVGGCVCSGGDRKADYLHVVARVDGNRDRILVVEHIFRGRHVEITGRDNGGGDGGHTGNILHINLFDGTAPGSDSVVNGHLRRISLLGTQNLHVDRDVIPVVAEHLVAVERNLVIILSGDLAVSPGDDEFHVRLHGGTGLPRHRIRVERLDLSDMSVEQGINRSIDRCLDRDRTPIHGSLA